MKIKYHHLWSQWCFAFSYLKFKEDLLDLNVMVSQSDPSVFKWIVKLNELLCSHIDDFLFGRTQLFKNNIIAPIK